MLTRMRRYRLVVTLSFVLTSRGLAEERAPQAPAIAAPASSTALALSNSSSCVLSRAGTVSCWGLNVGPRPGLGDALELQRTPHPQEWNTPALAIAATEYAACAVLRGGKVHCRGQQGYVTGGTPGERFVSTEIPGLRGVTALYAGGVHLCAVAAQGVYCWGSDSRGESSTRAGAGKSAPVRVELPPVRSLALGSEHTCALTLDGRVYCWGGTELFGHVGERRTDGREPHEVPALQGAVQLAAGDSHTCALRPNGHVVCMGHARVCELGRLGAGSKVPAEVPAVDNIIAIAAAGYNTCALRRDHHVLCWGDNQSGQLGNDTIDANGMRQAAGSDCTPTLVGGLEDASAIALSPTHACALRQNGYVVCWGGNRVGQLGDGTIERRLSPVRVLGL